MKYASVYEGSCQNTKVFLNLDILENLGSMSEFDLPTTTADFLKIRKKPKRFQEGAQSPRTPSTVNKSEAQNHPQKNSTGVSDTSGHV